jgi:carbonic anhydrase
MCQKCDASTADHASGVPRRNFLKLAAAAAAGLALPRYTVAAEKAAPPKSGNVLSPGAAFDRLLKGNTRYVNGAMKSHDLLLSVPPLSWAKILLPAF